MIARPFAKLREMQNVSAWKPSKYVMRNGRLRASAEQSELAAGSRLVADLVAAEYDRALKLHARGRLLDMGCGKVPLYEAYRDHISDVECIDWGNSLHGVDHLDRQCDLSGAIPYPDAYFDTIILSDVLEHLPEPMNCWREMSRLLTPGGKVLLNVPFYYQVHEAPYDFYRYTEFALRRFADSSGFQVVELKAVGGALEILADLAAKLLVGVKLKHIAVGVQSLAGRFTRSGLGLKAVKRTSERFPFGYFMVAQKPAGEKS